MALRFHAVRVVWRDTFCRDGVTSDNRHYRKRMRTHLHSPSAGPPPRRQTAPTATGRSETGRRTDEQLGRSGYLGELWARIRNGWCAGTGQFHLRMTATVEKDSG